MSPSTRREVIDSSSERSLTSSLSVLASTSVQPESRNRSSMPRTIGGNNGLVRSGMSMPTVKVRLIFRPRAREFGW